MPDLFPNDVTYPAMAAYDQMTAEPDLSVRGQTGVIVLRNTDLPVEILDLNRLVIRNSTLTVNQNGYLPAFIDPAGVSPSGAIRQLSFKSGEITQPIDSPQGWTRSAAGSRVLAEEAREEARAIRELAESGAFKGAPGGPGPSGAPGPRGLPGLNAIPAVEAVRTYIEQDVGVRSAIDIAASGTYVAHGGNRGVFDGDSVSERPIGGNLTQASIANYASVVSGQRIRLAGIAAVSGSRIQAMVDRFDTRVAPLAPNFVHLLAGTNDTNDDNPTPLPAFIASMRAYIAKTRAIGSRLFIGTIPPNNVSAARRARVHVFNAALRDLCTAEGIDIVDYFGLLVDEATGAMRAEWDHDGTHPTNAGNAAMARLCAATIAPLLPNVDIFLPQNNGDPNNLLTNGLFLGQSGTAGNAGNNVPTGWSHAPTWRSTTGGTREGMPVADPAIPGNWWRETATNATVPANLFQTAPAAKIIAGHRYAYRGRARVTGLVGVDVGAGPLFTARVSFNGSSSNVRAALNRVAYNVDGVFNVEFVMPEGVTSMIAQVLVELNGATSGTYTLDVAQLGLYDLTAMGLA